MRIHGLEKRIEALEPEPETRDPEGDARLMQAFEGHFSERLQELGCSEILDEVKAALQTVGPRPFGHMRADDHPYWCALDPVKSNHEDLAYKIRAAEALAWADVLTDFPDGEEGITTVATFRKIAADALEFDSKQKQTTCDGCGQALEDWWCYSGKGKICRSCSGC